MRAFRRHHQAQQESSDINISPLIDIVFILLIFFIVVAEIRQETGIEVKKPKASSSSVLDRNSILFGLKENGEVYYDGTPITLDEVRLTVRRLLAGGDRPVVIQGDGSADIQHLSRLIEQAQAGGAKITSFSTDVQ